MQKIDKNFRFLVVGGGTAGWLSALFFNRYFPESKITLVESQEIGILGAGEGTTPHFFDFVEELNLPITELMIESDATFKNGIKFTNWNEDPGHYYHPFKDFDILDAMRYSILNYCNQPLLALECISENKSLDNISLTAVCSENNKVRYVSDNGRLTPIGSHAFHFNASKLAKFLSKIAVDRGVKRIEGIVENSVFENKKISSVILKDGQQLNFDFLIDCSGFKRRFIGQELKSHWKSYKDYLPVKCAIPFFISHDNKNLPTYTESIAMDYGWVWKIPVKDRFGCGYVFDSDLITRESAIDELERYFGRTIESPKTFNFEAGHYTTPWVDNTLAVGLAAGFVEPLEATSIWVTIQQLHLFLENINGCCNGDRKSIENYNLEFTKLNNNIFNFVYFHYLGTRNSSEFWQRFKVEDNHPDDIKEILKILKTTIPNWRYWKSRDTFTMESWWSIIDGLGKFNRDQATQILNSITQGITKNAFDHTKKEFEEMLSKRFNETLSHDNILDIIKKNHATN
jgi:tryptophan halogenase